MAETDICKLISPEKFYGAKTKKRALELNKALETQVKKLKKEKIPHTFHARILGPSTQWKIFFRQQDAFDFTHGKSEDLHVFAFESKELWKETGQRQYLVASYPVFWHYYVQLDPSQRHHYEVIPDGAACKLYFDLEFQRDLNPTADDGTMEDVLTRYVCAWLKEQFQILCDKSHVLSLDASTESKFSRHLIFQTKDVFQSNVNAGNFVREIFWKLDEYLSSLENIHGTLVVDDSAAFSDSQIQRDRVHVATGGVEESADEQSLVNPVEEDLSKGVSFIHSMSSESRFYKNLNNENFKHQLHDFTDSKMSPIGAAPETEEKADFTSIGSETREDAMSDSSSLCSKRCHSVEAMMATEESCGRDKEIAARKFCHAVFQQFTDEELGSLFVRDRHGKRICFADLGVYTKNRNFRLYKSCKLRKNNPLEVSTTNVFVPKEDGNQNRDNAVFLCSLIANVRYDDNVKVLSLEREHSKLQSRKLHDAKDHAEILGGSATSPYPEIDHFILGLISVDGQGVIRRWTYFPIAETLSYDIAGHRFCYNIQRQHKSNNIKLVVDLKRGVWYQKCYDPDCQAVNFKSQEFPVPENTLPVHFFKDDFSDLEDEDDQLCLAAVQEAESRDPLSAASKRSLAQTDSLSLKGKLESFQNQNTDVLESEFSDSEDEYAGLLEQESSASLKEMSDQDFMLAAEELEKKFKEDLT